MSGEEDTRILNMRINNKDFLKGTSDSLKALDSLNKGIDGAGKSRGLDNMSKGIQTVQTRFGALQIAGTTALANLANRATNAGIRLAKSLTVSPVMDGFREYEKLLTSTQTIMANTGKSTKVVGKYLGDLNTYSDQTIYNFGQMADSIGRFTAAGVKLGPATDAIKGLANSAALAGSDANQLNTAMYQMSQAMATGTIKLMDWNSLANAGMGGKSMRDSLMATARTMDDNGKAMDSAIAKHGNFRESLSEGWLTADVFTKSMKVMGGTIVDSTTDVEKLRKMGFDELAISSIKAGKTVAFSVKQLMKMGYSRKAAEDLNRLSQAAIDSATKIKTFSQLVDVVKESLASGWARVFQALFGNLEESTKMWTSVGDKVTGVISRMFDTTVKVLDQWRELGGYGKLWGAIGNIFKSLGNIFRPFLDMLGAVSPGTENAGTGLYNLTNAFYQFSVWLERVTSKTSVLTPAFELLGKGIRFVFGAIGAYIGSMFDLLKLFSPLASAVGDLVGALSDLVAKMFDVENVGDGVSSAFTTFENIRAAILKPFIDTLADIVNAITKLVQTGDFGSFRANFKNAFGNLASLGDLFSQGKEMAGNLIDGLQEGWSSGDISNAVSSFVDKMLGFFKGLLGINSPSTVFMEYGRNIVEGLAIGLSSFGSFLAGATSGLGRLLTDWGSDIADLVGKAFGSIGDAISGIDRFDLANIFSVIFGSGVLMVVLRFTNALSQTMSTFKGFAESVMGENGFIGQATNTLKTMQKGIMAKALLNIALAIGVLALSLWVLSKIPHERLATGLVVISALIGGLALSMKALAANAKTTKTGVAMMAAMAAGMISLGLAVLILSGAVLAFSKIPTDMLVKGGIAVGIALGALAGTALVLGKASPYMVLAAAGVFIISGSLLVLASALVAFFGVFKLYEKMDWGDLGNGLAKISALLIALGLSMMPLASMAPMILIASVALVILSAALVSMLGAVMAFSQVDVGSFGKGIGLMAAGLIALGLAAIVAAPGIIALGVGSVLLGTGLLAAGAGMTMFAAGFAVLVAAGTAGSAVLIAAFEAFLAVLPLLAVQLVAALDSFLSALAAKAPSIVDSLIVIIGELVRGVATVLIENAPIVYQAAITLMLGLIQAITDNMPAITSAAAGLIAAFLQGMGENSYQLAMAAGQMILDFLEAIRTSIEVYAPQIGQSARGIATAIIIGLATGLVPEPVRAAIVNVVNGFVNFFKRLLGINSPSRVFANFGRMILQGLANGITNAIGLVVGAITRLATRMIGLARRLPGQIGNALSTLGSILRTKFSNGFSAALDAVTNGLSKLRAAIGKIPGILRDKVSSVGAAAKDIGDAIVGGIVKGLKATVGAIGDLGSTVKSMVKSAINSALNLPLVVSLDIDLPGPKNFSYSKTVIPAFAKGVTGFGGGSALVGEKGPELVTMGRGSNVITNELLTKFINQVNSLTRMMTTNRGSGPGGSIQYVVSANFRGNPKKDGIQFAADIARGLSIGVSQNESSVNASMASMATGMAETFADILQIRSPSKVFWTYASFVGKGFINGLLASIADVKKASKKLGESSIDAIAKTISDGNTKLEALRGRANAYANAAENLREKAKDVKNKKRKTKLLERAKDLERQGKKEAKTAKAQAKKLAASEAAAAKAARYKAADTQGKANMDKADAQNKAKAASDKRELAITLSKQADLIRKFDKERAKKLDKAAKAALKSAKTLADESEKYAIKAHDGAIKAKAEAEEKAKAEELRNGDGGDSAAKQLGSVTAEAVARAQEAFNAYAKSLLDAQAAAQANATPGEVKFEQNNYSPEAISAADAYRNGKSLISIMERKLTPVP